MTWRVLVVITLLAAGCGRPAPPAPAPAPEPEPVDESGRNPQSRNFRVPDFDENGIMVSQIFGDEAVSINADDVEITGLRIEFYKYEGDERLVDMMVTSPSCVYYAKKQNVRSDADIRIARDDFVVTGTGYVFNNAQQRLEILSNAQVTLKGAQKAFQPPKESKQ